MGVAYRPTYRRSELIGLVSSLGLARLQMVHDRDLSDPLDPRRTSHYDALIGEFLERARARPDLVARGLAIRARLHDVGIVPAGALFILGFKP